MITQCRTNLFTWQCDCSRCAGFRLWRHGQLLLYVGLNVVRVVGADVLSEAQHDLAAVGAHAQVAFKTHKASSWHWWRRSCSDHSKRTHLNGPTRHDVGNVGKIMIIYLQSTKSCAITIYSGNIIALTSQIYEANHTDVKWVRVISIRTSKQQR